MGTFPADTGRHPSFGLHPYFTILSITAVPTRADSTAGKLPRMRLRVGEILRKKQMTAYGLSRASGDKSSCPPPIGWPWTTGCSCPGKTLTVLCDVLEVEPGELLTFKWKVS